MKLEWIGVSELYKYGINYEFYPILEALQTFYENSLFYNVFKYFVRSIENLFKVVHNQLIYSIISLNIQMNFHVLI